MKSERRHELEQNQLADWLGDKIAKIKPYQNAILGVILLVAVAILAFGWWRKQATAEAAAGWEQLYATVYDNTRKPSDLDKLVDRYAGEAVSDWARAYAGNWSLITGCNNLFVDKAVATDELHHAVDCFTEQIEKCDDPQLLAQATFGLARAYEAQLDREKAIEQYKKVAETWPECAYAAEAQRRAVELGRPSTRRFYDAFADFNPKRAALPDAPGTPGQRPAFNLDSLTEPDAASGAAGETSFPSLGDLEPGLPSPEESDGSGGTADEPTSPDTSTGPAGAATEPLMEPMAEPPARPPAEEPAAAGTDSGTPEDEATSEPETTPPAEKSPEPTEKASDTTEGG